MLVHEVVFINYFFRYQADGNLVVFMLHHDVVKVKVLDVDHEVPGVWVQYDAVPMQFCGGDIGCWGGDWSIKGESISSHSESHSGCLFLLVPNVAYNASK